MKPSNGYSFIRYAPATTDVIIPCEITEEVINDVVVPAIRKGINDRDIVLIAPEQHQPPE